MKTLKTKDNAFKGMTQWNGIKVILETNKTDGKTTAGVSGKTMRYATHCGSLFLSEEQIEEA